MNLIPMTLDDGQVIAGRLGDLNQHQLISLANQLYRLNLEDEAYKVMKYQHKRFYETQPTTFPPMVA